MARKDMIDLDWTFVGTLKEDFLADNHGWPERAVVFQKGERVTGYFYGKQPRGGDQSYEAELFSIVDKYGCDHWVCRADLLDLFEYFVQPAGVDERLEMLEKRLTRDIRSQQIDRQNSYGY